MKKKLIFHSFWLRKKIIVIPLAMKLLTVFMFAGSMAFSASTYSQRAKIDLKFENSSLTEILNSIEKSSEFIFIYNANVVNSDLKRSISVKGESIDEVLNILLQTTNISYRIDDRQVFLYKKDESKTSQGASEGTKSEQPQKKEITGTVKDSKGQPLPGASVIVKGTTIGTITNNDGIFTLSVPADAKNISFSFVGMSTQEVAAYAKSEFNITLTEVAVGLDEVVAIGYGSMKKSDLTGSVGSVSSERLVEQPSVSPIEALAGKVAGVDISNESGRPGGDFRISIRGMGSINASNGPLFVIDGFVGGDINLINTNDIETMNVLKDASATAIYGAQGANGVVIITTKRADKGKVKLTYDGSVGVENEAHKIDMLNATQFMQMRARLYDDIRKYNPGEAPNLVDYATDYPNLFNTNGSPKYNTNWQDKTLQTAVSKRNYLTITGSTDKFNSGISIGYQDEEGIMKTTFLEKTTARFFGEYKMNKWLKFGADFSYGFTKQNRLDDYRVGANTPTRVMIEMAPIFPVQYANGQYSAADDIKRKNGAWDIWYGENSVGVLNRMQMIYNDYQILGNFYLDLQLTKDLKFRTSYGAQSRISNNKMYVNRDWDTYSNMNQANLGETTTDNWQFENLLTFNKVIGNHNFGAMAGASWYNSTSFGWAAQASNFSTDFYSYNNIGMGTNPSVVYSGYTSSRMNSYFARANYSFKDKYLATATIRYDGSSRFGVNNRYAFFPSAALGWRVNKENFLKDSQTITNLKLRASFGETGNNTIGDYLALGQPGSQTVIFNKQKNIGSSQGSMPNSNLKWEKSSESNIGIDLQLFSRIIFTADFYNRLTSDLLYAMPVPQLTGYGNAISNIGSTLNKGIELTLETQNIIRSNFKWNTTLLFSTNRNTVKSLGTNNADMYVNVPGWFDTNIMRVGQKMGSFFGYTRIGTWGTGEADQAAKYGLRPGDIKLLDRNNDGKIDINDKTIIGNGTPDFTMNINNTFKYKNWDLSFDIQVSHGAKIADASIIMISDRYNYGNTYTKFYNDAWTPQHQNTMRPRVRADLDRFDGLDTGMLFDGSFIRGKNFTLGYNVPESLLKRLDVSSVRLYASAQNFFLITKYHGFDPEVSTYDGNQFSQGFEMYGYPKAKVINFGLKVTF